MQNDQNKQDSILRIDDEVLAFKKRVDEAKSAIDRIQAAILDSQECINQAQATIPVFPDRKQERGNIMADIALGNATHDDLLSIDKKISDEKALTLAAQQKVEQTIADHQATLEGLSKKLEIAQRESVEIESQTDAVACRYFEGLAGIAAEQYAAHAEAMKELYLKLYGLALALKGHGGKDIVRYGVNSLQIPKFNLSQFDGIVGFPANEPGMILNADFFRYGDFLRIASTGAEARFAALLTGSAGSK